MKSLFVFAAASALGIVSYAAPRIVCDFDDFELGQEIAMWNCYGDSHSSKAVVEADPKNPDNKVLHVYLNDWNTFAELTIPADDAAIPVTDGYTLLTVDVYRSADDANDYKMFRIWLGDEEILTVDGYPHQGNKQQWQNRTYELNAASADNASKLLHIGMHSDKSDYYLDNIVLKGPYDDYAVIEDGVIDICVSNTSSNYMVYDTPLIVNQPLTVYTSRYTEFKPNMVGTAPISLYCGGERTFLGAQDGSYYPDWSAYSGDVHIYRYDEVEKNAGFYGLVLNHGGKRFNPEDIEGALATTNSQLINNTIILHEGAALATPTGIRGVRIGNISTDPGSRITGPMKASSSNASYFVLGSSDADANLQGRIAPTDKNGAPFADMPLGIIKEGKGTYRIFGNDNLITGAIRVLAGRVMIDNDIEAAKAGNMQGAIGHLNNDVPGIYVFTGATVGGYGHSASVIDLYGNLEPGDNGIGTLSLCDFVGGNKVDLRLRPTARLVFDVASADNADCLCISGNVEYRNIGQDFVASDKTPIIEIVLTDDASLKAGDEITLIKAAAKTAADDADWAFRVQYPKAYTWSVEERYSEAAGYTLVACVTSEQYSGQGDIKVEDEDEGHSNYVEDIVDEFDEMSDDTPLRVYASAMDKCIGVALTPWRTNVDNDSDPVTSIAAKEFNIVVAENEMKFDNTEPSRGYFSYGDGDRLVNFGKRHNIAVRGHALAWHKQMPSWLSSDGGQKNDHNFTREELLSILENHITNVVGHFSGSVQEWDVVNECLSDDQSIIRTNPEAYALRQSVWYTGIGEDYIDSAFVYARRANPDALLILNDYGVEFAGQAKTEALFNLARRLQLSGIPIDGIGLQCHLDAGKVDGAKLWATIDKFAQIGLRVIITELDLGVDDATQSSLEAQADDYRVIASVAMRNDNCRGMLVWGFSDDLSWRSSHPLLYDGSHQRKPAYYGVHGALRRAVNATGSIPAIESSDAHVVSTQYYTLQGIPTMHPQGLVIAVMRLSDGSMRTQKLLLR